MTWQITTTRTGRLTTLGAIALLISLASKADVTDLNGVWFFTGSNTPGNLQLTSAGQAALDSYEPLTDDSDNYCIPVSFTNILHTPSPPFEIRLHEDHVEINYEFMDVSRRVPLDPALTTQTAPYTVPDHPHMGRSTGRFEGNTLVVNTAGQQAGVLDTLGVPGLPQSDRMRTEERFTANGDVLDVIISHDDPVNYADTLVVTYGFHRLDSEILAWDCTPEAASYDRFLEAQDGF